MKKTVLSILLSTALIAAPLASAFAAPVPCVVCKPPVAAPKPVPHSVGNSPVAGYLGLATACSAVALIADGAYHSAAKHEEIPPREAAIVVGACFIPVVGGFLVDAIWQPKWDALYRNIERSKGPGVQ